MKEYLCSVDDYDFVKIVVARNFREASKRCAWGYVQGKDQSLEYVVRVSVSRDDEVRRFRVRISIYPHFEIHEDGGNTFVEGLINNNLCGRNAKDCGWE